MILSRIRAVLILLFTATHDILAKMTKSCRTKLDWKLHIHKKAWYLMMLHLTVPENREPLPPKKKRKLSKIILRCIVCLLAAAVVFTLLSPVPVSILIRAVFNKKIAVAPDGFEEIKSNVKVIKNATYPSEYKDNAADIYLPENQEGPFPVVLWIHGGAFVGGDKEDIEIYATALAAKGFAVVCMNYRRAPEAKYPIPIAQTNEAYLWIKDVADQYLFDTDRLVLAGDSAGAHVAAQFAVIQSNPSYAAEMEFNQSVPLHTLKAVLLFCGPFDVAKMEDGRNSIMNFFIGRAAWAYFGKKDWGKYFSGQATIANHVTGQFPPTFITDGNKLSFEEHGRALADVLKNNGVWVETHFIPIDTETTGHEYQFIMNTSAGEESFRKTVQFIQKCIE